MVSKRKEFDILMLFTIEGGEYITSFIGRKTPFPRHLLSPDDRPGSKKQGIDSGHDEASESSSEEEDPMEEREELKWKKGRLLGKGAFGKVSKECRIEVSDLHSVFKVWEGLMDSAKLIAVKEVDLDVETEERAEAVNNIVMIFMHFIFTMFL